MELFCIQNEENIIINIYINLEKAKNKLKQIYQEISDYKHHGYKIVLYKLANEFVDDEFVDNEYIISNIYYTYRYDKFYKHTIT